jgi:hypothetical protein
MDKEKIIEQVIIMGFDPSKEGTFKFLIYIFNIYFNNNLKLLTFRFQLRKYL